MSAEIQSTHPSIPRIGRRAALAAVLLGAVLLGGCTTSSYFVVRDTHRYRGHYHERHHHHYRHHDHCRW